jgi:hypothetical protein
MRGNTKRRLGFAITAGVLSLTSEAAVYRCEQGGRTVYTDTPCAAGSEPIAERQPTSIAADGDADLAAAHDERRERELDLRSTADAQWLRLHEDRRAEAARVRQGLVEGRVVAGMSAADVRHVRGAPDSIEPGAGAGGERWVYRRDRKREVVQFENGRVKGPSAASRSAAQPPRKSPQAPDRPKDRK